VRPGKRGYGSCAETVDRFAGAADDEEKRAAHSYRIACWGRPSAGATMGIYDREYYRDETRGSGFFSGIAPACKTIILVNVVLFFAASFFLDVRTYFGEHLVADRAAILHGEVWRLVTSPFINLNIFSLIFNMLIFWSVARDVETMYGPREFIAMYVTAGVLGMGFWTLADSLSPSPFDRVAFGCAGPLVAVLVLYASYNSRQDVSLFGILQIRIWVFVAIVMLVELFNAAQGDRTVPSVMVAFTPVLVGAIYGYLYRAQDLRWSRLLPSRKLRPRLRVITPESRERDKVSPLSSAQSQSRSAASASARPGPVATEFPQEQLDARLDEVLAKIAREGRAGLTEEENRVLQEASQRARDRRSDRP
jgi:rhomboid family protein